MGKLKHTLTNDVLFKLLFVRNPELLPNLVATLLGIEPESIEELEITNSEMLPEVKGGKLCRLDINMRVDGRIVNLEVQVKDEGNYPERSLHNWARLYSGALNAGQKYQELPRTIVVSIVEFSLFDCAEFHSEFRPLEVTRGTLLTDKMCLHYFELNKLPKTDDADDMLGLWLSLFKAKTETELKIIENKGIPIMTQAVEAYRRISVTNEFAELERAREKAALREMTIIGKARREGERKADEKWQGVVAEKDNAIAQKDTYIVKLEAMLGIRDKL